MLGKSIKSIGMIDQTILLSNLSNDRLVLRGLGSLIHSFFPLSKTLLMCFDLLNVFLIGWINGLLWFNAGDFQFGGLLLLDRPFQLNPINPNGRRCSISIFSFMNKELSSCFLLAGVLLFSYREFSRRVLSNLDVSLDDLGILERTR